MTRRLIVCDTCDFTGVLKYDKQDFVPADISFCPVCGADISEDEQEDEDEE